MKSENKKRCVECKEDLVLLAFNRNSGSSDGLQSLCRSCQSKTAKTRRIANKEYWEKNDPYKVCE